MKFSNWFRQITPIVSLIGTLLLVSCSDQPAPGPISPVTPTTPRQQSLAKASTIKPVLRTVKFKNGFGGKNSKIFASSSGGKLAYMGHAMNVPKDAFPEQQKEFSITDVRSDWIQAEYGPNGTFLHPVTVTMSYADADLTGINTRNLTISWYDTASGTWIEVGGTVDQINKTISVKVWHFTQYTISTK